MAREQTPERVQAKIPTIANSTPLRDKNTMISITSQQNRSPADVWAISANGTLVYLLDINGRGVKAKNFDYRSRNNGYGL